MVEVRRNHRVGNAFLVVRTGRGRRRRRRRRRLVGRVLEAVWQALAVRDVDREPLAILALLAVVVPREEVRGAFLEEGDRHRDRGLAELRLAGRPLHRVAVRRVVVVAERVRRRVVRLHHRVVLVRVEDCESTTLKVLFGCMNILFNIIL